MKQQQRVCAAPRCERCNRWESLERQSALHAAQAVAALDAGLAVFCQKPLGRTAAETARVLAVALRETVARGTIGPVHAIELVFHNAYGPDKPWFQDPALSGGGCVIDLGIHLVDLLLLLEGSAVERLACSWFSHEGRDAVIETTFRGRDGAAGLHDVAGSFYDFAAEVIDRSYGR